MSTQNLNIGPARSSGHKEATEEHATAARLESQGESGNPSALLTNRLLSNAQVSRAALYASDDFSLAASSTPAFDVGPDDVRKVYDGLLTSARQGDPTAAGGDGAVPKNLALGGEGKARCEAWNADWVLAELGGKPLIAARTATYILLVQGVDGANTESLQTTVQSFTEGLEKLEL